MCSPCLLFGSANSSALGSFDTFFQCAFRVPNFCLPLALSPWAVFGVCVCSAGCRFCSFLSLLSHLVVEVILLLYAILCNLQCLHSYQQILFGFAAHYIMAECEPFSASHFHMQMTMSAHSSTADDDDIVWTRTRAIINRIHIRYFCVYKWNSNSNSNNNTVDNKSAAAAHHSSSIAVRCSRLVCATSLSRPVGDGGCTKILKQW